MPEDNQPIDTQNSQNQTREQLDKTEAQRIFEERFNALMNGFGDACESQNINLAVAIAVHPKENEPLVFVRGDEYNVARVLAYVLKRMKADLIADLNTEI